jgi:hypothetical protein
VSERKKVDRRINADEVAVVRAALSLAATASEHRLWGEQVDDLRVVSACTCGCDTIDFADSDQEKSKPIADGIGQTARGGTVGIIVWGTSRDITGLEVYDLGSDSDDLRLPIPSSIRPWKAG